jgi:hypothetical protein
MFIKRFANFMYMWLFLTLVWEIFTFVFLAASGLLLALLPGIRMDWEGVISISLCSLVPLGIMAFCGALLYELDTSGYYKAPTIHLEDNPT